MPAEDHRQLIGDALKRSTVWIADAHVEPEDRGWTARLVLCPKVAESRAEQQGLSDRSLRSAICERGVIDLLDSYIAKVNETLPTSCQVVSRKFDLSLEPESERHPPSRRDDQPDATSDLQHARTGDRRLVPAPTAARG